MGRQNDRIPSSKPAAADVDRRVLGEVRPVVACDEIGVRKNNRTTNTDDPYIMVSIYNSAWRRGAAGHASVSLTPQRLPCKRSPEQPWALYTLRQWELAEGRGARRGQEGAGALALNVRDILTYPCIFCMDNH
jgi:hypothetical protein